jgi:lipid II:glycine glycyltransferase (peptidoglycan interpeptide bridge formation enzyme)
LFSGTSLLKQNGGDSAAGAAVQLARQQAAVAPEKSFPTPHETYCLDPLSDPRWQALVESHPHASVFHSVKWLKALRTVYNYQPVAVTTCGPQEPLTNGAVFCRVASLFTGHRLVSLPFSDHCEPLFNRDDELEVVVQKLKEKVNKGEYRYIEFRPLSYEPSGRTGLCQTVSYYFHAVDLRRRADQLFAGFHKDCVQRKIRRAEREQLQYESGSSEALLQQFYRLTVMTRRRHRLPPQPLRWFRGLIESFGDDLKIRVASKNGTPVASILTLNHKKSVVYKYGCSDAAYSKLGGTPYLFWRSIQEAKAQGLETLELGRSDTGNAGLIAFKQRWGAAERRISYWTYPRTHSHETAGWKMKLAQHLVPALPDFALELAGKVFYRHIG